MGELILQVNHLSKAFGSNLVLRDIDFTVEKGDVISIIGASGSGKSTLLRCINPLCAPLRRDLRRMDAPQLLGVVLEEHRVENLAEAVEAATQEAMDSARAADYSALDSFGVMISKKEMTEDEESAFHELTKAVTDRYDASKKTVDDLYAEVSAIDPAAYGSYYTDAYKTDVTSNMDTYTDAYNKGRYQNAYDALNTVKALYAAAEGDQNRAKERSETYAAKAEAQQAPAASAPAPAPAAEEAPAAE